MPCNDHFDHRPAAHRFQLVRIEPLDAGLIRLVFVAPTREVSVVHQLRQPRVSCQFPHPFDHGGESLGSDSLDSEMCQRAVRIVEFMTLTLTYGRLAGLR